MARSLSTRPRALAMGACLLAAAGASGCAGAGAARDTAVTGRSLTIYSSLPLQGDLAARALDVQRAEQLALAQARYRVGKFRISYRSLDDSTFAARRWQPSKVSANARKAAQDKRTIAYIGELDTGASAISIPILNQAGLLEVSPADGLVGLTRKRGASRGEPDKYYPDKERNFGRVVAPDNVQAAALLEYMRKLGVKRLYVLDDGSAYGTSLGDQVRHALYGVVRKGEQARSIPAETITPDQSSFRQLASKIVTQYGADAVLYAGTERAGALRLWRDLYAIDPKLKLFGPNSLAVPTFYERLGPAASNTYLTDPVPQAGPAPTATRTFVRDFRRAYGSAPDPYAQYGYEAMQAVLAAIREARSQGNDRKRVIDEFFGLRRPESVLGSYSIDQRGDPTLGTYAAYRVRDGKLVFDRVLRPSAA